MNARRKDDTAETAEPIGPTSRSVAVDVLRRIDEKGSYANLVLSPALERSGLSTRDRGFATELVYGTTRMQRACDYAIDRFLLREIDPEVRTVLRIGAYQLIFLKTPPHAAVGETVELAPKKVRGLVNAVLRRIADQPLTWPNPGTRLSYPDWILEIFARDHGIEAAEASLAKMNEAPTVSERADGYIQDEASQWVVDAVSAQSGHRVLDVCAAPGGKATGLAATGAMVIAADRRKSRVNLIVENAERYLEPDADGTPGPVMVPLIADATAPPFAPGTFDRVLVDAPCSGLGVLRRRADARWRVEPEAPSRLAELQRTMIEAAAPMVAPGGLLVYSVCTITVEETTQVLREPLPGFSVEPLPEDGRWSPWGIGGIILPHEYGSDGMALFRLRRSTVAG